MKLWRKMANTPTKPTQASVCAAAQLLQDDEAIDWESASKQCDYLFFIANILNADDMIYNSVVKTSDCHEKNDDNFTPYSQLLNYEKIAQAFEIKKEKNQAGKHMVPELRNAGLKLQRLHTLLDKLDTAVLTYNLGTEYADRARSIGWMGHARFAEWCRVQQPAFLLRIDECRRKYVYICHAFLRDEDTPEVAKSWPPSSEEVVNPPAAAVCDSL